MRRIAAIAAVVVCATVAYGKPRPREIPTLNDIDRFDSLRPHNQQPSIASGAGDTIFYGGTTWMPDSMRWEAIRDSVWTFDTGVGSSINTGQNPNKPVGYHETMEGWFGIADNESWSFPPYFRRSSSCPISGTHSMWAGVTEGEAESLCFAGGQGYGNGWSMTVVKSFQYPGSGSVTLNFDYSVEAEPGFDYSYVLIDTTGAGTACIRDCVDDIQLRVYTGVVAGIENVVLSPGTNMRSTPGPVSIKFLVVSDPGYSDEDGIYVTDCGHTVLDDVTLSGAISDFSDFELNANGWVEAFPTIEHYSNLAFMDSLPPPAASGPCSLQDSVLVFFDSTLKHPANQQDLAISPWIDLKRGGDQGRPGFLLSYDVYADVPYAKCPLPLFVVIHARWQPNTPCSGPTTYSGFHWLLPGIFYGPQFCTGSGGRFTHDLTNLIEPGAEQIQVAILVYQSEVCLFDSFRPVSTDPSEASTVSYGNSSPWFDNVRFGVYGAQVAVPVEPSPVAARLAVAVPNPMRSSTRIDFTMPGNGRLTITILDAAGRRVGTLINEELSEGSHSVDWNGLDESGHRVSAGVYFYRMTAEDFSETRKLVVLRN